MKYKDKKIQTFLIVIFLSILFLAPSKKTAFASMKLTDGDTSYIVENDYYKAIIPKGNSAEAKGIIKHLYIKRTDGTWSEDLVYQGYSVYGLGFLEGGNDSGDNTNSSFGLQNSKDIKIVVTLNTSEEIDIQSSLSGKFSDFTETWIFWDDKRYFESTAQVVSRENILANQLQFAWMVDSNLNIKWYGTDAYGNIKEFSDREFQTLQSPHLNTFPWINWQFTDQDVSLGLIFTDIYDHYATVGETGDRPFEYQLNFELGSGSLGNPQKKNYTRRVTTLYYTDSSSSNSISDFAAYEYNRSDVVLTMNPTIQAAAYTKNSYGQNSGISSSLVNSPYFLVRQNSQNMVNHEKEGSENSTSIYAPLYKTWDSIHDDLYDYQDQLQYSVNYSDQDKVFNYGKVISAEATNSDTETILVNNALSEDEKLRYRTQFITWSDSDKLEINGEVENAQSAVDIKDLFVSFVIPDYFYTQTNIVNIGDNTYDIQFDDPVYGKLGIAIKALSSIDSITQDENCIKIYVLKGENAKSQQSIDYTFDILIYPHKNWLETSEDFSSLHTKELEIYFKHQISIPQKIREKVVNTINTLGVIRYSSESGQYINCEKMGRDNNRE